MGLWSTRAQFFKTISSCLQVDPSGGGCFGAAYINSQGELINCSGQKVNRQTVGTDGILSLSLLEVIIGGIFYSLTVL